MSVTVCGSADSSVSKAFTLILESLWFKPGFGCIFFQLFTFGSQLMWVVGGGRGLFHVDTQFEFVVQELNKSDI